MIRVIFVAFFVLTCIVETQDAMFTNGRSIQEVIDEMIDKAMTKVSKKLQDKLEVLKDNKYALKIWKMYKKYYKKNYTSSEEERERLGKFLDNLKLIIQENFRFDEGFKSFKLSLNQFGDMSLAEFRQKLTGLNGDGQGEKPGTQLIEQEEGEATNERRKRFFVDSVKKKFKKAKKKLSPGKSRPGNSGAYDNSGYYSYTTSTRVNPGARQSTCQPTWRTVDYRPSMQPVENQGRCGSCYAFAVTAAIEGTHSLKTGSRIKLSKQQLVDCSKNNGCNGGYLGGTYEYIKERGGLSSNADYPYQNASQSCKLKPNKVGAIKGYGNIMRGDEEAMKQALCTYGPLAAAIHTTSDLQFYSGSRGERSSGIIDIPRCSQQVDHAIVIVGFGTENGKDYWLVRNSWGANWGQEGYFKIARNKNSMCGIGTYGYYTIL